MTDAEIQSLDPARVPAVLLPTQACTSTRRMKSGEVHAVREDRCPDVVERPGQQSDDAGMEVLA